MHNKNEFSGMEKVGAIIGAIGGIVMASSIYISGWIPPSTGWLGAFLGATIGSVVAFLAIYAPVFAITRLFTGGFMGAIFGALISLGLYWIFARLNMTTDESFLDEAIVCVVIGSVVGMISFSKLTWQEIINSQR